MLSVVIVFSVCVITSTDQVMFLPRLVCLLAGLFNKLYMMFFEQKIFSCHK